jgi:hypothetical protein
MNMVIHMNTEDRFLSIPNLSSMTSIQDLPKQRDIAPTDLRSMAEFEETVKTALGSLVYARSGDKGANVNIGFFFPAGNNATRKWAWLRSFLTTEKLRGKETDGHSFGPSLIALS